MVSATHHFPDDFLWGTATASHQVEGDNRNNDWWNWEQKQHDKVFGNHTSGLACDWWNGRAEEDIQRMADLGTKAHRLSIEWSRIETSAGKWNYTALDRYRQILNTMLEHGIQPMVTLHHFTNPIWMTERGGWTHPDSPEWFDNYVQKVVSDLADVCFVWCTINEPNVYATNSYFLGSWPPGQSSIPYYFRVVKNLIKAHALAYKTIHSLQSTAEVGLAKHMIAWHAYNPKNPLDQIITRLLDKAFNEVTLRALKTGEWKPPIGQNDELPKVTNTLDWIGLNYYQRYDAYFNIRNLKGLGIGYRPRAGRDRGPHTWGEFYPEGLFELINRLHKQFHLPIYITENGMPDETDERRPQFILEHVRQVWKAVMWNIPVKGYYFWSLVDNFEWAEGYDPRFRFGLYSMDFDSQKRTLTQSGELYQQIALTNTLTADMVRSFAPHAEKILFPGVEEIPQIILTDE